MISEKLTLKNEVFENLRSEGKRFGLNGDRIQLCKSNCKLQNKTKSHTIHMINYYSCNLFAPAFDDAAIYLSLIHI